MALTNKLTTLANIIRAKSGYTGKMTIEEMAAVVATISAVEPGDLPQGIRAIASGTYTCATAPSSNITIPHGLGTAPNFFILYAEGSNLSSADFNYFIVAQFGLNQSFTNSAQTSGGFRLLRYGVSNGFTQMASAVANIANSSVFAVYNSSTYQLKPGITYRWIAGVVDGI